MTRATCQSSPHGVGRGCNLDGAGRGGEVAGVEEDGVVRHP